MVKKISPPQVPTSKSRTMFSCWSWLSVLISLSRGRRSSAVRVLRVLIATTLWLTWS